MGCEAEKKDKERAEDGEGEMEVDEVMEKVEVEEMVEKKAMRQDCST